MRNSSLAKAPFGSTSEAEGGGVCPARVTMKDVSLTPSEIPGSQSGALGAVEVERSRGL